MRHQPPTTNNYRRIYTIGLAAAGFLIVAGSIWLFADNLGLNGPLASLGGAFRSLTKSHLIIKSDHARLPANGTAQTTITATYPKAGSAMSAKIVAGTGNISRIGDNSNPTTFLYTAGISVGPVVIEVSLGSITERIELSLVDPVVPTAPQITSPPNDTKTNQLRPEIIGSGPANTKIIISNNGQLNTVTSTDDKGVFRVRLEKALTNGQQNLTAIATNDLELSSPPSPQIVINIESEPLKYDNESIRFSPNPVLAGNSFGLFIPASLNTEKVLVDFEGTVYELKNTNGASVFSRSLPAPANPGNYPASIILVDAANNSTRFDNALSISVVAP